MQKKTKVLFTIDDKYSPHWQITPTYSTEADAMVDFDRFVGPYHHIFAQSRSRDKTTHELWSKNKDEYWFWINSKPWPKIHVKMSKITVKE